MTLIIISIVLFVMMLLFPVVFSLYFLRKGTGEILDISQSKIKDPRYFAKSFTGLFDQKWANHDCSGNIILSRAENVLEADITTEYPPICNSIVYAENLEFRPKAGIRFEKEVYACQNVYLFGTETVRAICSKKDLFLGPGTEVIRWVDAEGILTVFDDCDLGISASSTTKIVIGHNCRFRRLYAPVILLGHDCEEKSQINDRIETFNLEPTNLAVYRNIKYVNDELADNDGVLKGSIITVHGITVLNHLTVKGHIRSHKSIRLCDDAVVYGNLFAEGDIYLGQNVSVLGTVFTQGDLYTESNVTIGQPGKIKSAIARGKVIFDKNCRVYGYVSSEKGGKSCPDNNLRKRNMPTLSTLPHSHSWGGYPQQKLLPGVISGVGLLVVIMVSIFATAIFQSMEDKERLLKEKQVVAEKLFYNVDGKPGGGQLDTEPMLVTKEHVYFRDRVLERFYYDANDILQHSKLLRGFLDLLPEHINKYLMLVPMPISFEEGNQYSDDVIGAINEIYAEMPPEVIIIETAGALFDHKDEYLFFRTSYIWTALGAYYSAEEFGNSAGIDIKEIGAYREYRYEPYLGSMSALPNAQALKNYPDYVSYYMLDGAANEQTITKYQAKDDYLTFKSPAVALSRKGDDIFVGAWFSHSILRGDAQNGKTLMILGDEYGKVLAPWLTPYYKKVILVNPKFFYGGSKEFWQLISEYQVTDFLIVEYAKSIGESIINTNLKKLYLD